MARNNYDSCYKILFMVSVLVFLSQGFAQEELIEKYECTLRMNAYFGN